MYTTLITIGRNQGAEPMSDVAWATFQADILDLLVTAGAWLDSSGNDWYLSTFTGSSFYEGVAEESAIFQLLHEVELEPHDYEVLRNHLKLKAREYKQECIALIPAVQADCVPAETREVDILAPEYRGGAFR